MDKTFEYRIQIQFSEGRGSRIYEQVVDWDPEVIRKYCARVSPLPYFVSVRVWRRPRSTWYPFDVTETPTGMAREATMDYGVDAVRLSIEDALRLARLPLEEEGVAFLQVLRRRGWKVVEAEPHE